jgi:uncharacterized protein
MLFDFSWDDRKARTNLTKHGVSFRLASSVFNDPLSVTIFDEEHSDDEDRWVTLGRALNDTLLVVIHTTVEVSASELHIRIISARRADRDETSDYEQMPR